MAVEGNSVGRVTRVVDQDFLGDKENAACGSKAFVIERSVVTSELHQVDRGQVASRVVEEHILGARVAGIDAPAVGAGVPLVDRRVVLHSGSPQCQAQSDMRLRMSRA